MRHPSIIFSLIKIHFGDAIEQLELNILSAQNEFAERITKLVNSKGAASPGTYSGNPENVLEHLPLTSPNVLLINDYSFEKKKIISFVEELSASFHLTKTILYTHSFDRNYLEKIFLSEVKSMLHKKETPLPHCADKLCRIIEAVNQGIIYIDGIITAKILRHLWAKGEYIGIPERESVNKRNESLIDQELFNCLTQRETDIMILIGEGRRNKEIADVLNISVETIEKHKSNIKHKLNLNTAGDILKFVLFHKKELEQIANKKDIPF